MSLAFKSYIDSVFNERMATLLDHDHHSLHHRINLSSFVYLTLLKPPNKGSDSKLAMD